MISKEFLKKTFAKYKRIEKVFFRADKKEDKANYIKLKYQFRTLLAVALLITTGAFFLLILYGQFLSFALPLLASVLIGFRFKYYNLSRGMLFLACMMAPVRYLTNDLLFVVPAAIMLTSMQILVQTQSEFFTLAHMIIQSLVLYFYGIEHLTQKIHSMTPEEIARIAQTAFYYGLLLSWINLITMQRFCSHMTRLLQKIDTLWNNLSKANSQLNDQNLKLQSNLEMKDVFIYTFSHELKNVLNGLLGNLTLAYDTATDPQMFQFLSSAKVCGEVIKNFVHNILDSGKLENGNLEVSPERKDVMSFMENIWAICGRIIENKRLKGYLEIEKNVPRFLELDEQRMIQIILNLVSNAVKFTEKGRVRIHISWEKISSSNVKNGPQEDSITQAENNHHAMVAQEKRENESFRDTREFLNSFEAYFLNREKLQLASERQKKFILEPQFYQLTLSKVRWNREEVLSSNLLGEGKGILKVQVLDTGCGMTPEDQTCYFRDSLKRIEAQVRERWELVLDFGSPKSLQKVSVEKLKQDQL